MSTVEFNQMLLNNTDFLKPFAFTLTRDNETAKDLLQETMFRALSNREKYNVGTNIKAWLYTIMRNIFINNYRRKVKQNTIFDSTPNDFFLDYQQATVANEAETSMKMKEIQKAIHQLPDILWLNVVCANRRIPESSGHSLTNWATFANACQQPRREMMPQFQEQPKRRSR